MVRAEPQDRLYNTECSRLLDNAEDVQDVVQDAFIHAYQSLKSFKGDSLFFTWLYRIAVNAAIVLESRNSVPRLHVSRNGDNGRHGTPDLSENIDPGYALEQAEEGERVQAALNRVSPEHRAVLILKEMEGQKYETMSNT